MSRIPTFEELGPSQVSDTRTAEPDFSATRNAAARITHTAGQTGEGAQALGRGIAQLGSGLSAGLEARQATDDKLQSALSSSSFASSILNLNDEASKATDPAKLRNEFPARYDAAMHAATANLDESHAKLFMAVHGDDLTRGKLYAGSIVNKLEGDKRQADTYESLNRLHDATVKSGDPNAHAHAIDTAGQAYDALADKGDITREVAAERKNKFVTDLSEARLAVLPPEERLRVLNETLAKQGLGGGGGAQSSNLQAADAALHLTPQEQALYQRHLTNLTGPGGITNKDGSRSTLFQSTATVDGKTYNIPTVFDGKVLPPKEALARAKAEGLDKFPSYGSPAEAEARYQQMHSYMEKDTKAYLQPGVGRVVGGGHPPVGSAGQLYNFFISRGWSSSAAHAINATLQGESGPNFNTGVYQNAHRHPLQNSSWNNFGALQGQKEAASGIANWNFPRAIAFKRWADSQGKNPDSLLTQAAYVDKEAREMGLPITSNASPKALTSLFTGKFEAPGVNNGAVRWANYTRGGGQALTPSGAQFGGMDVNSPLPGAAPSNIDTRLPGLLKPERLVALRDHAESEVNKKTHEETVVAQQEKVSVTALTKDDTESIKKTGTPLSDLTPERVDASYGPDARARFEQDRANAYDYHSQMNGIEQVSAAEMQERVNALAPRDGQLGFEDRTKLQAGAQKEVDKLLKVRNADPAAAADRLPAVQAAAKNASLDRPWSYTPLVRARIAAQEQLGIPEDFREPINNAEAKHLLGVIQSSPDKLAAIREVVETVNGAYAEHAAKALGYILRAYHGNEELRAQAGIMLQKIASGQPLGLDDASQFDEALTKATVNSATSKIQGAFPLPHDEDIEMLRGDPPKYSSNFDDVFGPGSAATAIGIGQ